MTGFSTLVRWSVLRDGEEIERVTRGAAMTPEEVKASLIAEEGYEQTIQVARARGADQD